MSILLVTVTPRVKRWITISMEWLQSAGSLNHGSLLQKSPMKKTIYRKRDVYVRAYLGVTVTSQAVDADMYGVATNSRILKMIGLLCKRALWKRPYSAKETHNFKEPTNRGHPIVDIQVCAFSLRYPHKVHSRYIHLEAPVIRIGCL